MNSRGLVGLALAVSLALTGGTTACTGSDRTSAPPPATETSEDVLLSGASIFDLDLDLVDHDGRTLEFADLKGEVMLAAMVYTSCTSVCIMVTEEMKRIEQQLSGSDQHLRYVLFSLDPGRDTPKAMRQFASDHHLDTTRWRLMAASEDGVRDLAAVLGVKYKQEENGEIAHSAMIFVIDGQGVVRHRQVGVGQDPSALIKAVARARR